MATQPAFASTPKLAINQVTAANTARDGTGTIVTLVTGDSAGNKIERIRIVGTGTTTAGVIRLFRKKSGGSLRLWREILVSAITPSTTVEVFSAEVDCSLPENICLLQNGDTLEAATHIAETFNIFVEYGTY